MIGEIIFDVKWIIDMHMSHPCDVPVMYRSSELKAC